MLYVTQQCDISVVLGLLWLFCTSCGTVVLLVILYIVWYSCTIGYSVYRVVQLYYRMSKD